jgi:hypothetical protein
VLVLHGAWGVERNTGDAAFLLWAEDAALAAEQAPRSGQDGADSPLHPLLASNAKVRGALTTLAGLTGRSGAPVRSNGASWAVRLPTRHGAPLPRTRG